MWLWNDVTAASGPCEGHQGHVARLFTEVVWWENRGGINWKGKKRGEDKVTKDLRKDFPCEKSQAVEQSPGRLCCLYPCFQDPAGQSPE